MERSAVKDFRSVILIKLDAAFIAPAAAALARSRQVSIDMPTAFCMRPRRSLEIFEASPRW
jgi:hypothetical protein